MKRFLTLVVAFSCFYAPYLDAAKKRKKGLQKQSASQGISVQKLVLLTTAAGIAVVGGVSAAILTPEAVPQPTVCLYNKTNSGLTYDTYCCDTVCSERLTFDTSSNPKPLHIFYSYKDFVHPYIPTDACKETVFEGNINDVRHSLYSNPNIALRIRACLGRYLPFFN